MSDVCAMLLYDKEDITQMFSYQHLYQTLGQQLPSAMPQAVTDARG